MPAETFHTTHQDAQPGEQVTESGIILPAGVDRQKNVRETITFDNLDSRSTKYNSAGVDPDNPYNAFAPELQSEAQSEAQPTEESARPLAADQPKRVRTNEAGGTEKLVKYADGSLEWVSDGSPEVPTLKAPEIQKDVTLHSEVLEEVAGSLENVENKNEKQDEAIEALRKQYDELARKFEELSERMKASGFGTDASVEAGPHTPKYPGQEVELYTGDQGPKYPGQELELYTGEEELGFEVVISEEMQKTLEDAQDKYAELTAKGRNSYVGHFLHNSKFLAKIPFVKKFAESINERTDEKIHEARDEYKQAVLAIQKEVIDQSIEALGDDPDVLKEVRMAAGDIAIQSEVNLELKIAAERMERSGKTNSFIDWWVRQEGLGGKLKKAGLIAGAGLTVGFVAGLGGAPLLGIAAGAGLGGGIGAYATKKRSSGLTEKNGTNTLAEKQGQEDIQRKSHYARTQLENEDGVVSIDALTDITEERTGREKASNRARLKGAAAAGTLGASAGASLGGLVREGITNATSGAEQPAKEVKHPPVEKPDAAPQAPAQPELQGMDFNVESGHGYTNELMDFAQANGHQLTPDQSFQLHQDVVRQFGGDYIDINGAGNDIYQQAGDFRLAEPGAAKWADGVGQYIQQWMANRGLW